MLLVNTFDVEPWWATVPQCVSYADWSSMPDRSEIPMRTYLDLCDQAGVRCTFFFVGWYAQQYPERVREVVLRGHEVGCHSLLHEDVATQSLIEFRNNTKLAKQAIEDAAGVAVLSYRAPSFSFPPNRCVELLGELSSLGFSIDSSIATAGRIHGGGYSKEIFDRPANLKNTHGVDIFEIPVPGVNIFGRDIQVFGGGYLRMTPSILLSQLTKKENYQVLYLHPHDFDRNLPKLPNSKLINNIRRKVQVGNLEKKVLDLFLNSEVRSCEQLLKEFGG